MNFPHSEQIIRSAYGKGVGLFLINKWDRVIGQYLLAKDEGFNPLEDEH